MVEYSENIALENQEVVLDHYPDIELVEEYKDLEKPKFDWNLQENLIACIQFAPCLPFPERLFQEFIVERQAEAFFEQEKVEEIEQLEPEEIAREGEEFINEQLENLPDYLTEEWIKSMQIDNQPKIIKLKRFIWINGIYIEVNKNNEKFQVLVEKMVNEKRIIVMCSGKSQDARDYLENLVNRFKLITPSPEVYMICNCSICQKSGLYGAHHIRVKDLENLKKRFKPKVQCYGSGEMIKLDEISNVKRPSFKTLIINAPEDEDYFIAAKKHLFPSDTPIISETANSNHLPMGDIDYEFLKAILNSDVILILISSDLVAGDREVHNRNLKMITNALPRVRGKELLMFFILIRAYDQWEEISPFNDMETHILNSIPIGEPNNDSAWANVKKEIQPKIEKWLHYKTTGLV